MIRAFDLQGGGDAFYGYDIAKERTRKRLVRNDGDEDRVYLPGYELYRRINPHGAVVEEIDSLHVLEGDLRVLLVDDVVTAAGSSTSGTNSTPSTPQTLFRYQYADHLASVSVELDTEGAVISYEEFHPYGTAAYSFAASDLEAPRKRYRYKGLERESETGLNRHHERCFLPWLGIWASRDPGEASATTSTYVFCKNNPTRFQDTTGRQSRDKQNETIDELIAWQKANKPEADKLATLLTQHKAALDRHDQQAADRIWAQFGTEVARQQHKEQSSFIKDFLSRAAVATVGALGWEGGMGVAGVLELSAPTAVAFSGLASAFAGVTAEDAKRGITGTPLMSREEAAASVLMGMALPLAFHGAIKVASSAGNVSIPPPRDGPSLAAFESKGGQRVFYVEPSPPSGEVPKSVAVRTKGNVITFDTATNANFVELAAEVEGMKNPGVHLHVGSGTHGSQWGHWAATNPQLADPRFFQEDVAKFSQGNLPTVGPRSVLDVSTPGAAASFATLEQTAASAPPGTVESMAAWCFSTVSKR